MTHAEAEICLKEQDWRDVRDYIIKSTEYRIHLDGTLQIIINILSGVALAVLIPSIILWINVGEMKRQIAINTSEIESIQTLEMQAQAIRASNVARIVNLERVMGVK